MTENQIALEVAKIYHDDFVYRHTNIWNIVYKSIFATIGLLSLPYFAYDKINYFIICIFPVLSIIICIFSIILFDSEDIRNRLIKIKLDELLVNNISISSVNYLEERMINYFKSKRKNEKLTFWDKLIIKPIINKIRILYFILLFISIVEIYLIVSKNFFINV